MGWAATADRPSARAAFEAPDGSVCLWDGRIDNRQDLLAQTGFGPDCAEAELVLGGYRKGGADFFRAIVGDWSLCIWDSHRLRLVLASDYAGIRPLYYYRGGDVLYWSSALADLVRWTGIGEVDETYVARFLTAGNAGERTPFAGIFSVPAGHALSIGAQGFAGRAFWNLPLRAATRYRDEKQYEERLLELFGEAVRVRLPAHTPACAELSGGLDSSSVVCMADRVRRDRSGPAPDLYTLSYTGEKSPDEPFFRAVEQVCNVVPHHLALSDHPAARADQMGTRPALWEPRYRSLARRMEALGAGVLLTGQFGDFIMGHTQSDTGQVADCLSRGRLGAAVKMAYGWARAMQVPVYPILWRGVRETCLPWAPAARSGQAVGAMPAVSADSLTLDLRNRLAGEECGDDPARHAPPGLRQRLRAAAQVFRSRALQTPETLQHISYTHPFAHRPLVEFMLTVPPQIASAPGQPRRLMRRAFAGLLPAAILNRKSKGSYASAFRAALVPLAAGLARNPGEIQVIERGYVERASLLDRLEKFAQGLDCNESQLRQILLLEYWLRSRTAGLSAAAAAASRGQIALL